MAIYPLLKDGKPGLASDGRPRFKVVVCDGEAKRQISRRAVGADEAHNLEADLLAACSIPLGQRSDLTDAETAQPGTGEPSWFRWRQRNQNGSLEPA